MRLGSQKRKIISLVLVFGCIYAVNACAHPLNGSFLFYISNQAPSSDLSKITISSNSADADYCKNSSGGILSIDILADPTKATKPTKIGIQYGSTNDFCYADIQYGGKYTTKVKITWVAATDGGNGAVIKSITRANGDPLGSDQAFKDWNKKGIQIATPYSMSVDELAKGKDTLTYSISEKANPIITLTNNAPPSTHGTNNDDITISSEGSPCMFKNQIAPAPKGGDKPKGGDTQKSFSIVPTTFYGTCKANIWYGNDATDTTPVTISWSGDSTNVKITLPSANSMSPTASPLHAFNTWNNAIAVHHGSMVKLGFETAGQVTFQPTDLPFPLLKTTPTDISLDTLAFDLLNKDTTIVSGTDLTIFDDYTHRKNRSRDIAEHMLIAAGMMKEHSQIPDDASGYPFSTWSHFFGKLAGNKAKKTGLWSPQVTWSDGIPKVRKIGRFWECSNKLDPCDIPYNDFHLSQNTIWYVDKEQTGTGPDWPKGKTPIFTHYTDATNDTSDEPDDTLAQTYLAVAFRIASDALTLKNQGLATQPPEIKIYSDISHRVKSAIYANNTTVSTTTGDVALKGTQAKTMYGCKLILDPDTGGVPKVRDHCQSINNSVRHIPSTTYSDTMLPFIYMFSLNKDADQSANSTDNWNEILSKTITTEYNLQALQDHLQSPTKILGAGNKSRGILTTKNLYYDKSLYEENMDLGDFSGDPPNSPLLTPNWSFGGDDDADYVPMSLGAYLLVAKENPDPKSDNHQDIEKSSTILKAEMAAIDGFYTKLKNTYKRIKCSMNGSTWSCDTIIDSKTNPFDLTPLDMSSYLLAQLGLTAHFGQKDDDSASADAVDKREEIKSLKNSFEDKIEKYVASKAGSTPEDVSTLSPIILAGLYIDDAFKPTPTDGTSFNNPLIDAHLDKDKSGNNHYYFTLDPSTSSTLGAQVRSGAQTSYRGE